MSQKGVSAETIRKAIHDAALTVQDCVTADGVKETVLKDWRAIARAKTSALRAVPQAELGAYATTFEVAARAAAALADALISREGRPISP